MLSASSPSLYCAIVICTMAFLRVEPAIAVDAAMDGIVSIQVVPLADEASLADDTPPIFLGHRSPNHYVVIIPTSSLEEARSHLDSIRAKVMPYGQVAFVTSHFLGHYIYAGSFDQRHKADDFLRLLQGESRARVVYFP